MFTLSDTASGSRATLVVLAGGASRRMGRAKADLPVAGTTLLGWIVARLGPSFAETLVVGAAAPPGARAVADRRPDAGPLAGIESGLTAMRTPLAFVVACDVPRAGPALAKTLLAACAGRDAAVPLVAARAQPACAAYAGSALPKIAALLDAGEHRVMRALDVLEVRYLDERELTDRGIATEELADIDTPAEYEAFVASLRA